MNDVLLYLFESALDFMFYVLLIILFDYGYGDPTFIKGGSMTFI